MSTMTHSMEEIWWQASLNRDREYDGEFILGVTTTGIYCRPSCPARKPKRENVAFFRSINDAQRAGLRACKRCKPDEIYDPQQGVVTQLKAYIESHLDETLTLAQLGALVELSPHHVQKMFKKELGVSPTQYANACRLGRFKDEVRQDGDVTRALYAAGFSSSSRLYEKSSAQLGMTPGRFGKGGAGETIYFAAVDAGIGQVLVAATERGLCHVAVGESVESLTSSLTKKFPHAEILENPTKIADWTEAIKNYLNGNLQSLDLPLDVKATDFQLQVWDALRQIPYGETRSYGEIASEIGRPNAQRAVAQACASNPVALVTPCHRVVRADGQSGGYRWGEARKQTLLELERSQSE